MDSNIILWVTQECAIDHSPCVEIRSSKHCSVPIRTCRTSWVSKPEPQCCTLPWEVPEGKRNFQIFLRPNDDRGDLPWWSGIARDHQYSRRRIGHVPSTLARGCGGSSRTMSYLTKVTLQFQSEPNSRDTAARALCATANHEKYSPTSKIHKLNAAPVRLHRNAVAIQTYSFRVPCKSNVSKLLNFTSNQRLPLTF